MYWKYKLIKILFYIGNKVNSETKLQQPIYDTKSRNGV